MDTCGSMCNEFWHHNYSETGQTGQSDSLEMNRMCKIGTLRREMRNIQRAIFSYSRNFDAISCKKMREYRKIVPENDPCSLVDSYFSGKFCKLALWHSYFWRRFIRDYYFQNPNENPDGACKIKKAVLVHFTRALREHLSHRKTLGGHCPTFSKGTLPDSIAVTASSAVFQSGSLSRMGVSASGE